MEEVNFSFTDRVSDLGTQIYEGWFSANQSIIRVCRNYSPAISSIWAMVMLEGHTLVRAAWHTFFKYRNPPEAYQLNSASSSSQRPILLLHGAAGSWNYLGDLAQTIQKTTNRAVYVLNTGLGQVTEEKRRAVYEKLEEITAACGQDKVDIVAHSMGGNLALYSSFSKECSFVNEEGDLSFSREKQANPLIGKVITIALPTNHEELEWVKEIQKENDLFNVNAKYDGLMGHKICALDPTKTLEVNAGHIGIVFQKHAHNAVLDFLHVS